jgi:hypothetical protein
MLGFVIRSPERSAAQTRVREWVRERFALPEETVVLVAEVSCVTPGCPPVETVIAFWHAERRHHYKVFKPVLDVTEDDLPPRWFMAALAVPEDYECGCC